MAERRSDSGNFWSKQVFNLGKFEPEWEKVMENDLDFSAGNELDNHTEKTIGNRLLLSGPLIDKYLEEIGKLISSKLSRSKLTGLVPSISMFIPWEIMGKITAMCVSYGSEIKNISRGKKSDKIIVFIEKKEIADMVFSSVRFDGTNYLRKRFFCKAVEEAGSKKVDKYNGCAEVVFSIHTPLRLDYCYETSKVQVSFYIQRYDKDDFVLDSSLQRIMNEGNN